MRLLIGGLVALIGAFIARAVMLPRGIRNNNPGNLRDSGNAWTGLVGRDSKGFCIFDTAQSGIRAMAQTAISYEVKHGIKTLAAFGDRWAPTFDNPGAKAGEYGAALAKQLGISPTQQFSVIQNLPKLCAAITVNENGYNPYPLENLMMASAEALERKGLA